MPLIVRCPGSCGELVQGSLKKNKFLITCPIALYSYGIIEHFPEWDMLHLPLPYKTNKAISLTLEHIHGEKKPIMKISSDLPMGKGMSSSTADIAVAALGTALFNERMLTYEEISKIALQIEPTDPVFYNSLLHYDYIGGTCQRDLGVLPLMSVLLFDMGGTVDTIAFNAQDALEEKIVKKEGAIEKALYYVTKGVHENKRKYIGKGATISAFANQSILYKKDLEEINEIGSYYQSLGTIIAHSGTIMGLLYEPSEEKASDCVAAVLTQCPSLTYMGKTLTTMGGIEVINGR